MTDTTVPRLLLEEAVDEIDQLRRACAYEALATGTHGDYATFPKSRRQPLADQIERLTLCAAGQASRANAALTYQDLDSAMKTAGAKPTLNAPAWEAEQPHVRRHDDTGERVAMSAYSAALDEIWHLRRQLAYEAVVAAAHGSLKSFPKSRRDQLGNQIERLTACARGEVERTYADRNYRTMRHAMSDLGLPAEVTVEAWLDQLTTAAR